jgi:tetratricopeptide (TPR) repeat protein
MSYFSFMPKSRMKNRILILAGAIIAILLAFTIWNLPQFHAARCISACKRNSGTTLGAIRITNPISGCIFPPEIVAPAFRWDDTCRSCNRWLVTVGFSGSAERLNVFVAKREWRPDRRQWGKIKALSLGRICRVDIIGRRGERALSASAIDFSTSNDPVGSPIFYREVTLPFADAVRDPSRIRWRYGTVSQERQPPIVLQGLPVCGNCHSFSADGRTLGMDVDYANDKGGYAITRVMPEMNLATSDIISWSDYRPEDSVPTFGLLSQVSPDGRFVASTVKDISVFVPRPDLYFSQLFFPIKGIILIYTRKNKSFAPLPGADDTSYVQSNPTWSPDGRYLLFARSRVYHLKKKHDFSKVLLTPDECDEFLSREKEFKFDIYRILFNDGRGGKPEPLEGASMNGASNYFPRYSPDGRWIAFCKASSFMLLQPDSRIYIMPAQGGTPRLMNCNTMLMNSWHSWSSNSRWLVFSSKANTPYTQLFITHVDSAGNDAPPVLLEQFTQPDRAANIPEFLNGPGNTILKINEKFIDDVSLWRSGRAFEDAGDFKNAAARYKEALNLNPRNIQTRICLGILYEKQDLLQQAYECFAAALGFDSSLIARIYLGNVLLAMQRFDEAIGHFSAALRKSPDDPSALHNLGLAYFRKEDYKNALKWFLQGEKTQPGNAAFCFDAGDACRMIGDLNGAIGHYTKGVELDPTDAATRSRLALALASAGKNTAALAQMREVIRFDPQNPFFAFQTGNLLKAMGKRSEAVALYQKALALKPDYEEAGDSLRTLKTNDEF